VSLSRSQVSQVASFVSPLMVGHVSFRSFFSSNSSDAVRPGYCISQFSVCFSRWFGGSGWGFPTRCAIFVHREFGCWVGICAFPFSPRRFANVSFARASHYVCFSFPLLGWFFVGTSYGRVVTAFGFLSWINYVSALGEISFFFQKVGTLKRAPHILGHRVTESSEVALEKECGVFVSASSLGDVGWIQR
jgi:hypothetical protein